MKIAIVLGTSRRNGNTANLVEYFIEQYPAQCTLFHLSNYDIAPYDYNFNNQDDDFFAFNHQYYRKLRCHYIGKSGVLVCTKCTNESVYGQTFGFIGDQ